VTDVTRYLDEAMNWMAFLVNRGHV